MEERKRVQKVFMLPSLTKQSFKDECDINMIMKRFKRAMGVDYLSRYQGYVSGEFGDFSQVTDYRTALEQIARAGDVFMALPAKVRAEFQNDPAMFLDFCQNPSNADRLVELGLATKGAPVQDAPSQNEAS